MEVYIIFCIILLIFSFYEVISYERGVKIFLLWVSFLGAVFIIGGRWETGTDWSPYLYFFNDSEIWKDVLETWKIEIGYGIFNWIIKNITDNYSFFLFLHAVFFYGLIIIAFSKLVRYPQTAFMIYFASNLGIVGSNRQLIAAALMLYGIVFLSKNNRRKYVFLLLCSFSFHATALVGAIYLFLNRYVSKKWIWMSLVLALIIGLSPLPLKLFGSIELLGNHFASKTEAYLENIETGLNLMGVLKRISFFMFFFYIRDKMLNEYPSYNLLFNGYWFGILIYLMFSSSLPIMISRGSLYFNIMEPLLFSSYLVLIKKQINKVFYLFVLFVLSILLMYQSINLYPSIFDPYKGIWFNSNYYRIL